jgi:ACS family tartrate transporter-like MFS transporter
MLSWGIVSMLFAFIQPISTAVGIANETTFYILRFLLGVCEAGFYPGVIFYLTLWFPAVYRAQVVALFMLAIPFSSIVGAPISGALQRVARRRKRQGSPHSPLLIRRRGRSSGIQGRAFG